MPARIRIRDLTEDKLPKSETAKFARGWSIDRLSEGEIEAIAKRMDFISSCREEGDTAYLIATAPSNKRVNADC